MKLRVGDLVVQDGLHGIIVRVDKEPIFGTEYLCHVLFNGEKSSKIQISPTLKKANV